MKQAKYSVVVVHGIGGGTGSAREHFSDNLNNLVAKECEGVDSKWFEATWEGVNDSLDEVITGTINELLNVYIEEADQKAKEEKEKQGQDKIAENARWYRKLWHWIKSCVGEAMSDAPAVGLRKVKKLLPSVIDALIDLPLYLDEEKGATIRRVVKEKIEVAIDNAAGAGVVLVGHSLGSVVAFDVVKEYIRAGESKKIKALVTMGSPLEWIANIRRALGIETSFDGIANIEWFNFYDDQDPVPLRRKLDEGMFVGVNNRKCSSGKILIDAHCAYWKEKCCAEKIAALMV